MIKKDNTDFLLYIDNYLKELSERYKFDYRLSIGLDGNYYLFFVADDSSSYTIRAIQLIEKFGFIQYEFGNHCYAHYYMLKNPK